ncbi:translocation/assembly module TamB domain-containing protein [Bradyrhizobium tropiciagri]|uniref:translocation/assembly module TamB domain-containing protein n=1 Tax=Bradyrhizobium tropiciagri TaxID=312253 RepID=UPI001BA52322|nr:translocation/assembly module TamB domain-containing protein [Bradyrhizobium tropiciagri]MBR0900101.1 translocation/assembly module TamB domain-containing protein [Bradyrhizobium tropiciagri]
MRARRIVVIGFVVAALGAVCVAVLGIAFYGMAGRTGENQQDVLASLVSRTLSTPATQIHIGAVDGVLSSDATVRDVSFTDKDGVWLTLDKARLVWRRAALLAGRLEIDRLEIGTLDIKRKPLPSDQPAAASDQPILPELPVKVQVKAFDLQALVLGQSILGEALSVKATGNTELGSPSEGLVFNLDAIRTDFPGRFKAALAFVPHGNALTLDVTLDEPAHGLMSKIAHLPGEPPVTFALGGKGTLDSFRGALKFQAGPTIDATGAITLDRNAARRILAARLSSHLGPLLPSVAAPVFAGETNLDSTTRFGDDGSVALDGLTLTSRLARLDVKGVLGADRVMDFSASIRALPSNGDVTQTDQGSIRSLVFDSRVNGPIKAPTLTAKLALSGARLPDGDLDALDASLTAVPRAEATDLATQIVLDANLQATGIAPRDRGLAAAIGNSASLVLHGSTDLGGHATIDRLEIGTPTVQATYAGDVSPDRLRGRATGTMPDLGRFSDLAGLKLMGSVALGLDLDADREHGRFDTKLSGTGQGIATGLTALDGLTGPRITLAADVGADSSGDIYTVRDVSLDGAHLALRAKGTLTRDTSDLSAHVDLPDLAAADARLTGAGAVDVGLTGGLARPGVSFSASVDRATAMRRSIAHLELAATINDVKGPCVVDARLDGSVDGKAARGIVQMSRQSGDAARSSYAGWDAKTVDIAIGSVSLKGAGTIDTQSLARGELHFAAGSLADLSPLALMDLAGSASLDLAASADGDQQSVRLAGRGSGIRAAGAAIRSFDLRADAADLYRHPLLNADAKVTGAEIAGQAVSSIALTARGNAGASMIGLSAKAAGFDLDAAGVLTANDRTRFDLNRFTARRGTRAIALQGPASFSLDEGSVLIEHLALGVGNGRIAVDGSVGKTLDVKAIANAIPLPAADVLMPGLGLAGTLDASAAISGSTSAATGQYRVTVRQLTAPQGRSAGLPPIDVTADGRLEGSRASIATTIAAGKAGTITASGTVPLDAAGPIALTAKGRLDAAVANAVLSASGRTVSGTVVLDARVAGTRAKPQLGGAATLSGGTFRDSLLGTRLDDIDAKVTAEGDRIVVERLTATTPNGGTLTGSGQVRLAPDAGFPGTVSIRGQQATLAASALATAQANLSIDVTGALARDPRISGHIDLTHVAVDIPDRLPSALRPIDGITHVNASGQAAARLAAARKAEALRGSKRRAALFNAALEVSVSAPNHVFIHGRGVTAELGGSVRVGGTTNAPVPKGAFSLYQGKLAVLGKTLTFTRGNLSFNGDLAPELDFVAEISASDITAQVGISGPAAAPVFAFTSQPELPQDEILSRILFQKASGGLSTAQALQLAETAAQFASGGEGTMDRLRRSLGVDSLDVSAGAGGPMVGASRAIGDRLSVGVRTGASASQSGVSANVDVTRHIRVESDVDAKGSTSVGVGARYEW